MKVILHIIKKEFFQFKRDPKMFGINLIAPVFQLILLGYAATMDVNTVHTIVLDQDHSIESRKFIDQFESSGFFMIEEFADNYNQVEEYLDNGNAIMAIVIPPHFASKINRKETTEVQALFNGSDGNTASIAAGYMVKIAQNWSANLIKINMESSGRKIIPLGKIDTELRVWYNPMLQTRYFMVPGIVGLLLSIITIILTSLAVVKEKEIGTLEQLVVTPITPTQLIIGKLVPFTILGTISISIVLFSMWLVFGIAVRGSLIFLFFTSFLYILSSLGLGLFVSTVSRTQQQALMIAIFAILMPMVFLSGFTFPIENMPQSIQLISYLIPLRYFMTIIRGVILKGLGFADLWQEALILLFVGSLIFTLSSLNFRKRLE